MQAIQGGLLSRSAGELEKMNADEASEAARVALVVLGGEGKPGPAIDSDHWHQQFVGLEGRYIRDISAVSGTVAFLRVELGEKEERIRRQAEEIASLQRQNMQMMELLKPYVNEVLENITKCLVKEIAASPGALEELKKAIGDKEVVTPAEVMTMLQPLLEEGQDSPELCRDDAVLEAEVEKLKGVITLLNLKPADLVQQISVKELDLGGAASSSGAVSYWSMAGTGARAVGHAVWGGTKMSGRLTWWICKNLVPLLTCGMVSAVVLESPWTPVLMFLLRGL